MAKSTVMASKVADIAQLYCSFCGKSQHEVMRLIAGPTVFICNECAELCNDIVLDDNIRNSIDGANKILVSVTIEDPLKPAEQRFLSSIVDGIELAYPGCKADIRSYTRNVSSDVLYVEFTSPIKIQDDEKKTLENEIRRLTVELRIAQQKIIVEQSRSEKYEQLYRKIQDDVMPFVIERLRKEGAISNVSVKSLTIMFLDIVGFSKLTDVQVGYRLDYVRSMSRALLMADDGFYINTWGDGIVAGFDDINHGLKCAWKITRHLALDGIEVRVSVHWGNARIKLNELTNREDIDGDSVNFGARLEPLADPGEVLVSEDIRYNPEIKAQMFEFSEVERILKKTVGDRQAGSPLMVFSVNYIGND